MMVSTGATASGAGPRQARRARRRRDGRAWRTESSREAGAGARSRHRHLRGGAPPTKQASATVETAEIVAELSRVGPGERHEQADLHAEIRAIRDEHRALGANV